MKHLIAAGPRKWLCHFAVMAGLAAASPTLAQTYTPAEQEALYRRRVEPLLRTVSIIALARRCDAAQPALPVQYDMAISHAGRAIGRAVLLIGADNNRGVRDYEEARAAGARFASPESCAGLAANAEAVLKVKQLLQAFSF